MYYWLKSRLTSVCCNTYHIVHKHCSGVDQKHSTVASWVHNATIHVSNTCWFSSFILLLHNQPAPLLIESETNQPVCSLLRLDAARLLSTGFHVPVYVVDWDQGQKFSAIFTKFCLWFYQLIFLHSNSRKKVGFIKCELESPKCSWFFEIFSEICRIIFFSVVENSILFKISLCSNVGNSKFYCCY